MNTLIILAGLGLITLFSEIFSFKKLMRPIIFIGLTASLVATAADWNNPQRLFNDMLVIDHYAVAFTLLLVGATLFWFVMSPEFFHERSSEIDHFALIVFALIGAVCMVNFNNMIMLFLGIEILSISLYILAGSKKSDLSSNEAALKYFLMGAFATGFLLFGIALVYGSTGTFDTTRIGQFVATNGLSGSIILTAGMLMILVAMAFKVSAAPFHFWAPDVYQGAPTVVTAFMSTVVKTAAFAAFLRLFATAFSSVPDSWNQTLWIIAALTILVGNIAAAAQTNFKRLLAYSSVAHAGYMILAVLAMNPASDNSLLFYTTAYSLSSLTAFAILLIISRATGSETIDSFRGLSKRSPFLAFVTVIAMLSLAGIPPTAGFFAKYYIFSAAIDSGYTTLVVIAIMGSLIGVYYYFRPLIAALSSGSEENTVEVSPLFAGFLLITAAASLLLGIVPGMLSGVLG